MEVQAATPMTPEGGYRRALKIWTPYFLAQQIATFVYKVQATKITPKSVLNLSVAKQIQYLFFQTPEGHKPTS